MTATRTAVTLARTAGRAAHEKVATDIVALDVSDQLVITDIFLIASAANERQIAAVVDAVEEALLVEHDVKPKRREGKGQGQWVLLDFGDVVVHVFDVEDRHFYGLDALWKDCPLVDLQLPQAGTDDGTDDGAATDAEAKGGRA